MKLKAGLICTVCALALATPATAQEASSSQDGGEEKSEIIVTAQRRAERLSDVPVAVTAIAGENLQRLRMQDATQIVQQIPNVTAQTTFGASAPLFSVRGVSNPDFNPSANTPVPIYSDDVLINNITGQGFALFDLDRVEVLKGPQGTLFGYNSSAGAIQFISRRPTQNFEASASASYASRDERVLESSLSGPLAGDSVRGRLAGYYRHQDGDFVNLATGKRIGESDRYAIRGLLDIDTSEASSLLLKAQYGRFKGDPAIRHTEQAVNNFTGETLGGKREVINELGQDERVKALEFSAHFNADLGVVGLDLISGFLKIDSGYLTNLFDGSQIGVLDLGYGAGPMQTALYGVQGSDARTKQFSQEARLTSQSSGPLSYILGAYYLHETLDGSAWFFAGDDSGSLGYFEDDPAAYLVFDQYAQKLSSFALFTQTDYKLTDKLKATVGGRVSWDKRSLDLTFANYDGFSTYVNATTVDPFHVKLSDVTDLSGLETSQQDRSWTNWSGRFALDYKPSDDALIYASLSRGVKSGAFNTAAFIDLSEANSIGPEKVLAYEAGTKLAFADRRIKANAAVFYYSVDNYHQKVVDQFGREFLSAADQVHFYGFELEGTLRPMKLVTAQFGVGWQKGVYDKFTEPTGAGPVDRAGKVVPGTGAWTANGVLRLDAPLSGDAGTLSPQIDFSYIQGSFYWVGNGVKAPQLAPASKTDDFFNLNLRLTWTAPSDRFSVTGFVQNVLDQYRVVRRNPVSFLDNSLSSYSPPRTFGVMVQGRF
ncbi:MAG: TonB-dependent receptor [Betaproteobacteria bacterium]